MKKKSLVIVGLVMVLVLSVVAAACAPTPAPSPAPAPAPAPPTTVTLTPTPGAPPITVTITPAPAPAPAPAPVPSGLTGDLVVAVDSLGREFYINTTGQWVDMNILGITNEFLAMNPPGPENSGVPQPGLAESWVLSEDGLTLDIYIRKGIQFNEGWGEFTAEDAKFSFELTMSEGSESDALINLRRIDTMTVVDTYHLRITWLVPEPLFLHYWSNYNVYIPMVSKKYIEAVGADQAGRHPVGTGPYVFKEQMVGEFVKYEAVENHWRKTPEFKTLTLKMVPEETSRIAMLKTGEADIINMGLPSKAEVAAAGLKIQPTPEGAYAVMFIGGMILPERETYDPTVPWVDGDDPEGALKVRKALALAIDKEAIIEHIFMGEASPIAMYQVTPGSIWDGGWDPVPYDPEQAKQLLAEAGYADGFEINMQLFSRPGRTELPAMGEAVAMNWEAIGLTVNRMPSEWVSFVPSWRARDNARTIMPYAASPMPDPYRSWNVIFHSDSGLNFGYESLEQDRLTELGSAALTLDERARIFHQIGDLFVNEYRSIGIAQKSVIYGLGPRVGEFQQVAKNLFINSFEYATKAK